MTADTRRTASMIALNASVRRGGIRQTNGYECDHPETNRRNMMTPDEIRDLYTEILARADYMRLFEPDGFRWDSTTERVRDGHRRRAAQFVDALANAGLLPAEMQQRGIYHDNGRYDWRPTERRYVTTWQPIEGGELNA